MFVRAALPFYMRVLLEILLSFEFIFSFTAGPARAEFGAGPTSRRRQTTTTTTRITTPTADDDRKRLILFVV
ncbi:hypothetical protein N656DRAFT_229620 [Canariomyces notabilis]|uniref:Secreted protein n=1 Tax=Canariomyces notabilis TaxID=2074819 RepID=A0AAN6TKQ5_9PEZI|nr:hypothetical protein N656DRAFT_229620 [Canariomyces arenarius]